MDLTLFEEILGFTGIGFAVFVAVLALFWRADDALSAEVKEDISLRLLCFEPKSISGHSLSAISNTLDAAFGKRYFSIRSFFVSAIASMVFSTLILLFVSVQNNYTNLYLDKWKIEVTVFLISFIFINNIIIDYISVNQTRFFIRRSISSDRKSRFLVFDFIATGLTIITIFVVVWNSINLFFAGEIDIDKSLNFFTSLLDDSPSAANKDFFFLNVDNGDIFPLVLILTTYLTSIWIWLYFVGFYGVRIANKSDKIVRVLQYVLPISSKPMRSIGLAIAPFAGLGAWAASMF